MEDTGITIRCSLHEANAEAPPHFYDALGKFSTVFRESEGGLIEASFDTVEHSLAFSRATKDIRWVLSWRPELDVDGFERWDVAAPGKLEIGQPLLPSRFSEPTRVFKFDMGWAYDTSRAANIRLINELMPDAPNSLADKGKLVWRAIKFAYDKLDNVMKVAGSWQAQVALIAGKQTWHLIETSDWYRHNMSLIEARQMAAIALADEKRKRLEGGTGGSRDKWRKHYADIDDLIALNS